MAKEPATEPFVPPHQTEEILGSYGLKIADDLQFKKRPGDRWQRAKVTGVNRDESIAATESYSGATRCLSPDIYIIEVRRRGPRGGLKWQPVRRSQNDT